jgi:hypothetical protein
MSFSWRARRDLLAAGLATVLAVLLYPGAFLRGESFFERDLHLDWYPRLEALARCLGEGAWPLWDRSIGFGQPLLADPGAQVAYPVTWLLLAVPFPLAYSLFVLLHLLLAAVGMARLAGRLGAGRPGALLAATVFVLSGPVQSSVNLWHHFAGVAWMPWVLLGVDSALRRPGKRSLVGLALAASLQVLAGSADVCAMTGFVAAGWTVVRFVESRRVRRSRVLVPLALAAALALAASAVVWWPAAEVLSRSPRRELPEDIRTAWSVPPAGLWRFVAPLDPDRVPFTPEAWTALYNRPDRPFLPSLYLGIPALAAVGAALLSRRDRRRALLLAAVAGGGIAVAMGPHAGVYDAATTAIPILKVFRYPSKATLLVALVVSLLAGLGVGALARRRLPPRLLVALGAVWLVAAALVSLLGARAWTGAVPPGSLALTGTSAVVLVLGGRGVVRPRLVAAGLATLVAGDLLLVHAGLNATAPPALIFEPPPAVALVDRSEGRRLYVYDYHSLPGTAERLLGRAVPYPVGPTPPGWGLSQLQVAGLRQYLVPPSGGLFGLEGSYDLDIRGLYPRPLNDLTFFLRHVEGTSVHTRLLRMGAVGTVLSLHDRGLGDLRLEATLPSLFPEAIRVWRVPASRPRAWVVGTARIVRGQEAFETLAGPSFDPEREVLLSEGEASLAPAGFVASARIRHMVSDGVVVDLDASAPGFLVFADAFDPGWRATVDARPVPVSRANVAFQAVPVPAGRHVVEMAYRPRAVFAGLTLTGLAVLAMVALGAWPERREPEAPGR